MKLFNTLTKKIVATVALVAAVAGLSGAAIAGFGPDRPTKDWNTDKTGFDHVVYNSFINVPNQGDERDFLRGYQVGRDTTWADPVNDVQENQEVEIKVYMHNNAATSLNDAEGNPGIARNVNVKVTVPAGTTASKEISSQIFATNALPDTVTDTLTMTGINGSLFDLEPVAGSGKLYEGTTVIGNVDVAQLVNGGVALPDQKGCTEFTRNITFRMKVKKPGYQIRKSARKAGETVDQWRENVAVQPGDRVEWRVFFQNTGSTLLNTVNLLDVVPEHMSVDSNSIELVRGSDNNTVQIPDSAIQAEGRQINIMIGDYLPQGGAYLYYFTTVEAETTLCGNVSLQNVAYATPAGYGAVNDGAFVTINTGNTCEEVVVKRCDALEFFKVNRTKFEFTAKATVSNATIHDYVFTTKNAAGRTVDTKTNTTDSTFTNYTFNQTTPGVYTVSVVVNTDHGVATGTCTAQVTVEEEPVTPVAICRELTLADLGNRRIKATVGYDGSPAARVELKNFEYNFGDGSTPLTSNSNPVEYTYAKDGTYKVAVKVTFAVDGVNRTVSSDSCAKVITITTHVDEKCPYDASILKTDAKCKPTTIVNTGSGSSIAMFIAMSVVGMFVYRAYALKRQ